MTSETMKYTAAKIGSLRMPPPKKKKRTVAESLGQMRAAGAFGKKGPRC